MSFLTGKQENVEQENVKGQGSAGLDVFLTGKQENVEQENVKTWARGGLELVFLTGKSWKQKRQNFE